MGLNILRAWIVFEKGELWEDNFSSMLDRVKGAGTPFSLIFVQFFSQKITSIVLSPRNYGYSTLTGIYLPTLGLI